MTKSVLCSGINATIKWEMMTKSALCRGINVTITWKVMTKSALCRGINAKAFMTVMFLRNKICFSHANAKAAEPSIFLGNKTGIKSHESIGISREQNQHHMLGKECQSFNDIYVSWEQNWLQSRNAKAFMTFMFLGNKTGFSQRMPKLQWHLFLGNKTGFSHGMLKLQSLRYFLKTKFPTPCESTGVFCPQVIDEQNHLNIYPNP